MPTTAEVRDGLSRPGRHRRPLRQPGSADEHGPRSSGSASRAWPQGFDLGATPAASVQRGAQANALVVRDVHHQRASPPGTLVTSQLPAMETARPLGDLPRHRRWLHRLLRHRPTPRWSRSSWSSSGPAPSPASAAAVPSRPPLLNARSYAALGLVAVSVLPELAQHTGTAAPDPAVCRRAEPAARVARPHRRQDQPTHMPPAPGKRCHQRRASRATYR